MEFSRAELEARTEGARATFVIDNVVYDVTEFLDEHPGGRDVLLDNAGGDASTCFHDVGHSDEARALMQRWAVGAVRADERREVRARGPGGGPPRDPLTAQALLAAAGPPLLLAALAWLVFYYMF